MKPSDTAGGRPALDDQAVAKPMDLPALDAQATVLKAPGEATAPSRWLPSGADLTRRPQNRLPQYPVGTIVSVSGGRPFLDPMSVNVLDFLLSLRHTSSDLAAVLGGGPAQAWQTTPGESLDGRSPLALLRTRTGERRVADLLPENRSTREWSVWHHEPIPELWPGQVGGPCGRRVEALLARYALGAKFSSEECGLRSL